MIEFLDFESPYYKLKQDKNGIWEAKRTSSRSCVEFTKLYHNIRDNYGIIMTHPSNPRFDGDVDLIIFRK